MPADVQLNVSAATGSGCPPQRTAALVVCTQVKALLSSGEVISDKFPCEEPTLP